MTAHTLGALIAYHPDVVLAATHKRGARKEIKFALPGDELDRALTAGLAERSTITAGGLTGATGMALEPQPGLGGLWPSVCAHILESGTCSNAAVPIFSEVSFSNGATAISEAGEFPEPTLSSAEVSEPVVKIATIVRCTEELFADTEAFRGWLDSRLRRGIGQAVDAQILVGDGTGANLEGIANRSSILTATGADAADTTSAALHKVRTTGQVEPGWYVLNPADWGNLNRIRTSNGDFLTAPFESAGPLPEGAAGWLWRKPAFVTPMMTVGTGLCGAKAGGKLFWRRGDSLTVEVSNAHESDFSYGRLAVRVWVSCALVTWSQTSFCKFSLA